MSRRIIVLLWAFIAAGCLCSSGYADTLEAAYNKEHAYSLTEKLSASLEGCTITKKGGPSGTPASDYETQGLNAAVLLSSGAYLSFDNNIVHSYGRYAPGVFALWDGSDDRTAVNVTSSSVYAYGLHSDGLVSAGGLVTLSDAQIGTGRLGSESYSSALTAYGTNAHISASDFSAWTSGDYSPVLRVYGTDGQNPADYYHMNISAPSEGSQNKIYSHGKYSPALYSTGIVQIAGSLLSSDASSGVVIDASGQVTILSTSIDVGHKYAQSAKIPDHSAIQIGSTISGDAVFSMTGGRIATDRSDIFRVSGTKAAIYLDGVKITHKDPSANLLKAESAAGTFSGVEFIVSNQSIAGNITAGNGSSIDVYLSGAAVFAGSVNKSSPDKSVSMSLQKDSDSSAPVWYLTANSYLSALNNQGTIIAGPYKLYVNGSRYTSADAQADGGTFCADYEMTSGSGGITITAAALPSGKTGSAYSADIQAESESSLTWEIADGELPEGLTLDTATGNISGTPTEAGTYTFVIEVFSETYTTARQYTLIIADGSASSVTIETAKLNDAATNSAYSAALAASGSGTIVWSVVSGFSLPAGLSLDKTTGFISGTPKKTGVYTFMVRAEVSSTNYAAKFLTLKVTEGSAELAITTDSLKDAVIGKAYSFTMKAKGSGTLTWTAEGLPDGLSISSAGKISGKASDAGNYNVAFTVTNGAETAESALVLAVTDIKPKIKASIKAGMIDTAYKAIFTATAGTGNITWKLSGDLPAGLAFDADNGVIYGKPTEGWNGYITILATNTGGTASKKCKLQIKAVKPKITLAKIPAATFGEPFAIEAGLTGTQPITLEIANLPEGLSYDYNDFDEVIKISGIPTEGGKFSVKITASNVQGKASKSAKITVNFAPEITTEALTEGYTGKSYNVKLAADGTKKITWALTSGTLPEGMTFTGKSGQLKGKPKEGGTFALVFEASNAYGSDTKSFDLTVNVTPPVISTKTIKKGKYGKAYSVKLKTKNAVPDAWDITGTLPKGITFSEGVFSGTPEEAFTGSIMVTASNEGGSDSKVYIMQIAGEAPKIATSSLPSGTVGQEYSAALEATGTPPIKWGWSGYPAGLTLDSETGKISGTPTKAGKYNITVTAENDTKIVSKKYKVEISGTDNDGAGYVSVLDGQGLCAEDYALTGGLPEGLVTAAEIPAVSVDVSGLYDFEAVLSESAPIGAKMYWLANPEIPSEDDGIAEFSGGDGQEIDIVPENRRVSVSAWLNAGVIYRPVIAVKP